MRICFSVNLTIFKGLHSVCVGLRFRLWFGRLRVCFSQARTSKICLPLHHRTLRIEWIHFIVIPCALSYLIATWTEFWKRVLIGADLEPRYKFVPLQNILILLNEKVSYRKSSSMKASLGKKKYTPKYVKLPTYFSEENIPFFHVVLLCWPVRKLNSCGFNNIQLCSWMNRDKTRSRGRYYFMFHICIV